MKKILTALLLFVGNLAFAQLSNVSATVTDSDSQTWNNGTYTISFLPPSAYTGSTYTFNGTLWTPPTPITGSLSSDGGFTYNSLQRNDYILPVGSGWTFTFCPQASFRCSSTSVAINSPTQNISSSLVNVAPRFAVANFYLGSFGYLDAEVLPTPVTGSIYYNVTDQCMRVWNGTTWACIGSSGGGCTPSGASNYFLLNSGSGNCTDSLMDYNVTTLQTVTDPTPLTVNADTTKGPTNNEGNINLLSTDNLGLGTFNPADINIITTENGTSGNESSQAAQIVIQAVQNDPNVVGESNRIGGIVINSTSVDSTVNNGITISTLGSGPIDITADSNDAFNTGNEGDIEITSFGSNGGTSTDDDGLIELTANTGTETKGGNINIGTNNSTLNSSANINLESQATTGGTGSGSIGISADNSDTTDSSNGAVSIDSTGPTTIDASNWNVDVNGIPAFNSLIAHVGNCLTVASGGQIVPCLQGTTASIGGDSLTIGTCTSGTVTVTGATAGNPVTVSASDGSLPNPLIILSASVTSNGIVTVQLCPIATVTPTAKTYNVITY